MQYVRIIAVMCWLSLLGGGLSFLFWYTAWIYELPTPVPEGYMPVALGKTIDFPSDIVSGNDRPVFLHFFNPDCPCSRFNLPHFRSLVQAYGDSVIFVIVPVMRNGRVATKAEILGLVGLDLPVCENAGLAASCGVYATPQAVITDADHRLYYRGNYNKSRYCTDKKSNYAQMAVAALLRGSQAPSFGKVALEAYGCQITLCGGK